MVSATAAATASVGKLLDDTSPAVAGEDEFLPIDEAFVLTSEALSVNTIQLNWRIADGYYLYKERIKVEPTGATSAIGALVLPKGENHHDEYFGDRKSSARASMPRSPCRLGRQDRRSEGDLPGLRGRRPVLSAEDQDADGVARRRAGGQCSRCRRPASGEYVSEQDSFAAKIASGSMLLVHGDRLPGRPADGVHALRAADGAHPVGHHRRRRLEHVRHARHSCCR